MQAPAEFTGSVGVARVDITPPVGIYSRNWGSARHEVADGVHRPLLATALAFGIGTTPTVLLSVDLSFWRSAAEEWEIRRAILAASDLQASQLILHQSHTHSAPPTALQFASRPGGDLIAAYRQLVIDRCSEAIRAAMASMQPATLTWARGSCSLAFDRHFSVDPGEPPMIGLNPDITADDTVMVGRVVGSASGQVVATILNYACHPVSLGGSNRLVSPDYVGAARETVEAATGGAPCLFLQGASGDLTPRRSYESDSSIADQNGRELGYAALSALQSMLPPRHRLEFAGAEESGATLALWRAREHVEAGTSVLRNESVTTRLHLMDLPSREELLSAIEAATDRYARERLERRLLMRESCGEGNELDFTFGVLQLGQSFIVSTPAEPHSPFQIELRRRFPGNAIAVANIANGYFSYLPPAADYTRGTYQTRVALFRAGSLDRVTDAAAERISQLLARPSQARLSS